MEQIKVKLTLTEEILGTLPSNEEVYTDYIASKAPDKNTIAEEIAAIGGIDDIVEKGTTIFARNPETNEPILYDYLIKGFFKNACKAMRLSDDGKSAKLSAFKTKIDNLVFVEPRMIPINFEGDITICQRPLRASTAQGDRVALASSEAIPAGATLEFTITVLDKSMMEYVEEWLDYGKYNGLGQWHNSGKGRFTWEKVKDKK